MRPGFLTSPVVSCFVTWLPRLLCGLVPPQPSPPPGRPRRQMPVLPKAAHAMLDPKAQERLRTIVIGDVHGCLDELKDLLKACDYDNQADAVVLVGDLVNKGPASADVVRFAREQGLYCVRGNHDDGALLAWQARERERLEGRVATASPKYAYTDAFSTHDVAFLQELPYTLWLPHLETLVVHAGVVHGISLANQDPVDMTTMRNIIERPDGTCEAHDQPGRGSAWAASWRPEGSAIPARHIIFGHVSCWLATPRPLSHSPCLPSPLVRCSPRALRIEPLRCRTPSVACSNTSMRPASTQAAATAINSRRWCSLSGASSPLLRVEPTPPKNRGCNGF